ncbi:hypothetical protein GQ53DRAFT_740832 [Thozetella sp. PMI_491]|nr:hypothetical protein GQ53DRAFT_740832 [Thozetella sp. PMI_491]
MSLPTPSNSSPDAEMPHYWVDVWDTDHVQYDIKSEFDYMSDLDTISDLEIKSEQDDMAGIDNHSDVSIKSELDDTATLDSQSYLDIKLDPDAMSSLDSNSYLESPSDLSSMTTLNNMPDTSSITDLPSIVSTMNRLNLTMNDWPAVLRALAVIEARKAIQDLLATLKDTCMPVTCLTEKQIFRLGDQIWNGEALVIPDDDGLLPKFDDVAVHVGILRRDVPTRSQRKQATTNKVKCGLYRLHKSYNQRKNNNTPHERSSGSPVYMTATPMPAGHGLHTIDFKLTDSRGVRIPWGWARNWGYVDWYDGQSIKYQSYLLAMRRWDQFVCWRMMHYNIECALYFGGRRLWAFDDKTPLCKEVETARLQEMLVPLNLCRHAMTADFGAEAMDAHALLCEEEMPAHWT